MPESSAQRQERHRRGREIAATRLDGFDDTRRAIARKRQGGASRTSNREAGKRAALEAYARTHGLSMEQLQQIRAAEAVRRGAGDLLVRTSPAAWPLSR